MKVPDRLARCLIIGCGCRGLVLARALIARGHAVRGTTRRPARAPEIQAAGAEPFVADPDRVATLMPALDSVTVVYLLLGSAHGLREQLEALHGSRLEMLLARLTDTTVRGLVYEARGSMPGQVLAGGCERVRRACGRARLPFELLAVPPGDGEAWLAGALAGVERLIT
jgi:hypothetical protein